MKQLLVWTTAFSVLLVLGAIGYLHRSVLRASFKTFPRVTFWAWERPEDLRSLDPRRYAVAYLDQTVFIADKVSVRPRMQRLLVPPSATVIAVVRIEAPSQGAQLGTPGLASDVANRVVTAARKSQVRALQIDFDAGRSQREFYRDLLQQVRKRLPRNMPLSITALASWCGRDSWLDGLPVDEAVPMLFRMRGFEQAPQSPGWTYPIREPLCAGSVGISTDEPWPRIRTEQRVYVFHPAPWNEVALQNVTTWTTQ